MENAYAGDDGVKQVRLQTLWGELESMKMKETKGVVKYNTRVETMVNQLSRSGRTLAASWVVEKILRSLTNNFENVVCAIEGSKEFSTLIVEVLSRSFKAHKQRKKKKKAEALNQLLWMKGEAQNTQGKEWYRGGIGAILLIKGEYNKKKKNSLVNKIGTEEDEVHKEEVSWATQMLSALNVASMTILQRTVTQTSVSVVIRSYIL